MESVFETKEQYLEMRNHFRKWYNTDENRKQLDAASFALYALLRGKDWRKCFAPNTSDRTIEDIERYIKKTKYAYMYLAPFGSTVTEEMIGSLRERSILSWGE